MLFYWLNKYLQSVFCVPDSVLDSGNIMVNTNVALLVFIVNNLWFLICCTASLYGFKSCSLKSFIYLVCLSSGTFFFLIPIGKNSLYKDISINLKQWFYFFFRHSCHLYGYTPSNHIFQYMVSSLRCQVHLYIPIIYNSAMHIKLELCIYEKEKWIETVFSTVWQQTVLGLNSVFTILLAM